MNEIDRELDSLIRATSPTESAGESLSSDVSELREGWSALAHVVQATEAAERFNEQAFLDKLLRSVEGDSVEPQRPREFASGVSLLLAGALAASVLLVAFGVYYLASQPWGNALGVKPEGENKTNGTSESPQLAEAAVPKTATESGLGWDDSLDPQIQYVGHSLFQLEAGDSMKDRSLQSLGSQLQQLDRAWEVDSL